MRKYEIPQNFTLSRFSLIYALQTRKKGKVSKLSPFYFVIRLESLCDSLGARTQDPILKRDVLYLLS